MFRQVYLVAIIFLAIGLISGFLLFNFLNSANAQEACVVDEDLLTRLYNSVFNRPLDAGSSFHIGKDLRTVLADLDNSAEKVQYSALVKAVKGFEEAKRAPGDITSSDKQQYLDLIESAVSTIAAWSETLPPQLLDQRVVGPEQARSAIQKAYEGMNPTAKQAAEYGIFNALRKIGPPSQITLPPSTTTASPSIGFSPTPTPTSIPTPTPTPTSTPTTSAPIGGSITPPPTTSTASPSASPTPTPTPTSTPTPVLQATGGPPNIKVGTQFEVIVKIQNLTCRFCEYNSPPTTVKVYYTPWYPNDPPNVEIGPHYGEQVFSVPPIPQWETTTVTWSGIAESIGRYYFVEVVDPDNLLGTYRMQRSEFYIVQ